MKFLVNVISFFRLTCHLPSTVYTGIAYETRLNMESPPLISLQSMCDFSCTFQAIHFSFYVLQVVSVRATLPKLIWFKDFGILVIHDPKMIPWQIFFWRKTIQP